MPAIINRKLPTGKYCSLDRTSPPNWRIYGLVFFIFLAVAVVVFKLYNLQVISHAYYSDLAADQHTIFKKLIPERGEIYLKDKDGIYPAAVNKETKMAYAVPKEIKNPEEASSVLAQILQIEKSVLSEKLNDPDDMYEVLKHRLGDEEIQKIRDANLEGIRLADEEYRYYPSGELASNILGFVGLNGNIISGRYGLESYWEKSLKGEEGNI